MLNLRFRLLACAISLLASACVTSDTAERAPSKASAAKTTIQEAARSWHFSETTDCDEAKLHAGRMNYAELIKSVVICEQEGGKLDASFFLLASQVRFQTDAELLFPSTEDDKVKKGRLFTFLYYKGGGSGAREIYRNREKTATVLSRLKAWSPILFAGYDPGWNYTRKPDPSDFEETVIRQRHNRIEKLKQYIGPLANDDYYTIQKKLDALHHKYKGRFTVNTEPHRQFAALTKELARVRKSINVPAPNYKSLARPRVNPDAGFKQIHTGSNGSRTGGFALITSEQEIKGTWLAEALSKREKEKLLSQINFAKQMLVVLAAGKRLSATGPVVVTDITLSAKYKRFSYAISVGVMAQGCEHEQTESYPFAISVMPRPDQDFDIQNRGNSKSNFSDGCKPPVAGEASGDWPKKPLKKPLKST